MLKRVFKEINFDEMDLNWCFANLSQSLTLVMGLGLIILFPFVQVLFVLECYTVSPWRDMVFTKFVDGQEDTQTDILGFEM